MSRHQLFRAPSSPGERILGVGLSVYAFIVGCQHYSDEPLAKWLIVCSVVLMAVACRKACGNVLALVYRSR